MSAASTAMAPENATVLTLSGLCISTGNDDSPTPLVTGVDLELGQAEILGLVGESGSGKSLTALSCMGLLPSGVRVTGGSILLGGREITSSRQNELRRLRGPEMAMIFQDPMTSLDPCFRIGRQMIEAVTEHEDVSRKAARTRAIDMLGHVGVPEPERRFEAFPHELSGGLRQRVMIATALLLEPRVLIADEPTTALDVTTQASILKLVDRLRDELSMSVLWISHDLAVVAELADRVAVMYAGEIVESTDTDGLFSRPRHHYTQGLLVCARHGERGQPFGSIDGSVPESTEWSSGCRFTNRCARADDECGEHPALEYSGHHGVRCVHPLEEGGLP